MPADTPFAMDRAAGFVDRVAVLDATGQVTYASLVSQSERVARRLVDGGTVPGDRVAFLVTPSSRWVAALWGIWRAGGIAVPLAPAHPAPELEYVLEDSGAASLISDAAHWERAASLVRPAGCRIATLEEMLESIDADASPPLPALREAWPALMVYTSGTTGRSKGVVTTHANIAAQITTLVTAWDWTQDDRILHVLPLHHVHGIINALCCALWSGARVEILPRFDAPAVWDRLASGEVTVFMAVPTIYHRLIAAWDDAHEGLRAAWSAGVRTMRLLVSGSAALPAGTLLRWHEITGHVLLERYGMTEIGMALSNPLHGERRAGTVGQPLPGVSVRLVDEAGQTVSAGTAGEIEVRGAQVFREYWKRPRETESAFREGWFRTGDIAVLEDGYYRILGRNSVDIIKSAGYKISALEVEEVLRMHPSVRDCAVVGVPDPDLGERVCAAIVADTTGPGPEALAEWSKQRLAPYKVPREVRRLADLPRNTMGKVMKPEIRRIFEGSADERDSR
jgi:malonyl-CoA/methylmalonyl-CoA synthetase